MGEGVDSLRYGPDERLACLAQRSDQRTEQMGAAIAAGAIGAVVVAGIIAIIA